jgi:WXG100 family type VII secretion target
MPDVQMNYETMEEMAKIFKNGQNQLADTMKAMEGLAQSMEDGALLGEGGDKFADALRSRLAPRIKKLSDKFGELNGDIMGAVKDLRDEDKEAASRFK